MKPAQRGNVHEMQRYADGYALVLSHPVFNARSGLVIVVAVTYRPQCAGYPLTVPLRLPGFGSPFWAKTGHVRTLPATRLGRRIARADANDLERIVTGLQEILGG